MKLHQIVKEYLDNLKYQIKKHTYLHYQNLYEIYILKHFNFNARLVENSDLNLALLEFLKKYSNSLSKTIKSLINRSLTFAYENNMIKKRILITQKIKSRAEKQVECLSVSEQIKIEKYILENKRLYSYGVLISLFTGLRLGELLSLKWKEVDFKNKVIKVISTTSKCLENHKQIEIVDLPKSNSSIREIPLTKNLINLLKELKTTNAEYVVCNKKRKKVDYRTYQSSFNNLLKKLNIKHYGFHSLRHTFATRLLENKVDIKTISELLGHSNPSITLNRYVHTNIENKRRAMQKIKFAV